MFERKLPFQAFRQKSGQLICKQDSGTSGQRRSLGERMFDRSLNERVLIAELAFLPWR